MYSAAQSAGSRPNFILLAMAASQNGQVVPGWRELAELGPEIGPTVRVRIRKTVDEHFVTDQAVFRSIQKQLAKATHPDLRRFDFTPLWATPLISGVFDADRTASCSTNPLGRRGRACSR
jgi:hypothetical protein